MVTFLDQGNNRSICWGWDARLTGMQRLRVKSVFIVLVIIKLLNSDDQQGMVKLEEGVFLFEY